MRIGLHLQPDVLRPLIVTPVLAKGKEELLDRRKSVRLLRIQIDAFALRVRKKCSSARRMPPLSAVFSPSVSFPFTFTSSTAVNFPYSSTSQWVMSSNFLAIVRGPPVF